MADWDSGSSGSSQRAIGARLPVRAIEVWTASFYLATGSEGAVTNDAERKKLAEDFKDRVNSEFLPQMLHDTASRLKPSVPSERTSVQDAGLAAGVVTPKSRVTQEPIRGLDNRPIVYVKFPLLLTRYEPLATDVTVGIRVNLCVRDSLSKIFVYFGIESRDDAWSSQDAYSFRTWAEAEAVERFESGVYDLYRHMLENLGFDVARTDNALRLFGMIVDDDNVKKFVSAPTEQAKELIRLPEVEQAFLFAASTAAELDAARPRTMADLPLYLSTHPRQTLLRQVGKRSEDDDHPVMGLFLQALSNDGNRLRYSGISNGCDLEDLHLPMRRIAVSYARAT